MFIYNKTCMDKELKPNYIRIKINDIIIWTMYNIYEIFYLIAVYKPEAAYRV